MRQSPIPTPIDKEAREHALVRASKKLAPMAPLTIERADSSQ